MERFTYHPKTQKIKDHKTNYTYHCPNKELYLLLKQITKGEKE